jgi:pimeloyl-ACP methyl ester carboxylesterase
MFSEATPPESVDAFGASMLGFHPVGFCAMARASAENLRDALPDVTVPTLLVYGDQDVRPSERRRGPPPVHPRVDLAVLPDAGHVCNLEASEAFNQTVRSFLHNQPREG